MTPRDDNYGENDVDLKFNNRPDGTILTQNNGATAIALGDIDGDARDEVAVVWNTVGGPALGVFYDPQVVDQPQPTLLGHPVRPAPRKKPTLVVGNIDADAREDILFSDAGTGTWALLNNTPPAVRLDNRYAFQIAIIDLNNDGTNDIVAAFGSVGVWKRVAPATTFTLLRAWPAESLTPCACD
jgi:hypothetical protein